MENIINGIKKSLVIIGVATLLVGVSAPSVQAARAPRDPETKQALSIDHIGGKVCKVNQSAGQVFCAAGSGMLYELCGFGTAVTAGKGVMAFDTVSSTQWLGGSPTFQTTYGMSPIVYGTSATGVDSSSYWAVKCWKPAVPARFENGLGLITDSTSMSAIAVYRLDSGVNP